jgi:transcriptional regulator with XRE-family HTH domain
MSSRGNYQPGGGDADEDALNAAIGSRVRDIRTRMRLTGKQVEEASAGGIYASHLSLLERGQRKWLPHHLQAVATALGVHPRDLLPPRSGGDEGEAAMVLSAPERALVEAVRTRELGRILRALQRAVEPESDEQT